VGSLVGVGPSEPADAPSLVLVASLMCLLSDRSAWYLPPATEAGGAPG